MAFNFYGTFSLGQYEQYKTWSKYQEADIKKRIAYLENLIVRNGVFRTTFDDNHNPSRYTISPPNSYAAKLMKAYCSLGGSPTKDFIIRDSSLVTFKIKGAPLDTQDKDNPTAGYSNSYSDGTYDRGPLYDRDVGYLVERSKGWQLEAIKRKREQLEFKIKRCLDYVDSLIAEKDMLQKMIDDPTKRSPVLLAKFVNKALTPGSTSLLNTTDDSIDARFATVADFTVQPDAQQSDGQRTRLPTSGSPINTDTGQTP